MKYINYLYNSTVNRSTNWAIEGHHLSYEYMISDVLYNMSMLYNLTTNLCKKKKKKKKKKNFYF